MNKLGRILCDGCRLPAEPGRPFIASSAQRGQERGLALRQVRPGHTPRWFHHAGCVRTYLNSPNAKGLDQRTRGELVDLADMITRAPAQGGPTGEQEAEIQAASDAGHEPSRLFLRALEGEREPWDAYVNQRLAEIEAEGQCSESGEVE